MVVGVLAELVEGVDLDTVGFGPEADISAGGSVWIEGVVLTEEAPNVETTGRHLLACSGSLDGGASGGGGGGGGAGVGGGVPEARLGGIELAEMLGDEGRQFGAGGGCGAGVGLAVVLRFIAWVLLPIAWL